MFKLFGRLYMGIYDLLKLLYVMRSKSLGMQQLRQICICAKCNKFFQIFNE